MATLDGYAPYPIGLTAEEAKEALLRSGNLEATLANFQYTFSQSGLPSSTVTIDDFEKTVQSGDMWRDTDTNRTFQALVENSVVVWLEN